MKNNKELLLKIIKILNEEKLQKEIMIVGSWAEMFYEHILCGYISGMQTLDLDLLICRPIKNKAVKNFPKAFLDEGFVYSEDYGTGKSKFSDDNFEVEFLTTLSRDYRPIYNFEELGVNAECLEYMDILQKHSILVEVKNTNYTVLVPSPAAYIIQKLLINKIRTVEKQEKDINAISVLFYIISNIEEHKGELMDIYGRLSKKQKRIINERCLEDVRLQGIYNLIIANEHS